MNDQANAAREEASGERRRRRLRWPLLLAALMRGLAAVWLAKGVLWWVEIFGFDQTGIFEQKRAAAKAVAIGFGVLDLVAAVGLWLLAAWGGVMWLLAVTTEIVLTYMAPRVFAIAPTRVVALVALTIAYLALSSLAASDPEEDLDNA